MAATLAFAIGESELAALEARLAASAPTDPSVLDTMVALAWHLRQRDGDRAAALRRDCETLMSASPMPTAQWHCLRARLLLCSGEALALNAEFSDAAACARQAQHAFKQFDDAEGVADARYLLSLIAWLSGDLPLHAHTLEQTLRQPHGLDPERLALAELSLAGAQLLQDAEATHQRWRPRLEALAVDARPLTTLRLAHYHGIQCSLSGDYEQSLQQFVRGHMLALELGLPNLAVLLACNAALSLEFLQVHGAALEWAGNALALARQKRWGPSIASALIRCATALLALKDHERARRQLEEAMALCARLPYSRQHAIALHSQGQLELACGNGQLALENFLALEEAADRLSQQDLLPLAWVGQAGAWELLDTPETALRLAERALQAHHPAGQIQVLQLMARLQTGLARREPANPGWPDAALQSIERALALAHGIADYPVPADLLELAADVHEARGELQRAYALTREAGQAHERNSRLSAANAAIAMTVAHETARLRRQHEQARAQAASSAAQAELLQQQHAVLQQLGHIGLDITTHLDEAAMFAALHQHVRGLFDIATLVVFRPTPDGRFLDMVFGIEADVALPPCRFNVDDPHLNVPRCARERIEICIDDDPPRPLIFAGTRHTHSKLYAPLQTGQRLLGVLSVQSFQPHAYGERERAIFRNLSAYAAIALANVDAKEALRQAQSQLAEQERLASLGHLVASVAHEINTPIGVVKSCGEIIAEGLPQTLMPLPALLMELDEDQAELLFRTVARARQQGELLSSREERALTRALTQELQTQGIAEARVFAELMMRLQARTHWKELLPLLQHARAQQVLGIADGLATLVRSAANINSAVTRMARIAFALERFSPSEAHSHWREIDLRQSLEQALQGYQHLLRQGTELVLQLEEDLLLQAQAEELQQVWSNLIHNALQAMKQSGRLTLRCARADEDLLVEVADTGCGIPDALLPHIFEPFFSTKPAGEGSGLGLDIARKIVRRHGGSIEVRSVAGQGSSFLVRLPPSLIGSRS